MSRINRVPFGLQDLLGSQNLGVNPADMSLTVAPTVDMFPLWAAEKLYTAAITPAAINNSSTEWGRFDIPQGESWIPLHLSALAELASAGDTWAMRMQVGRMPNVGQGASRVAYLASTDVFTATATADEVSCEYSWPQRVVFPSGVFFSVVKSGGDVTGADGIGNFRLVYYLLRT